MRRSTEWRPRERANGDALAQRVQRLEDLLAIYQLFVDYGRFLDAGDVDAYASLFAEDGGVLLGPRPCGGASRDQGAHESLAGERGRTYHIVSSPQVSLDGDRATSSVMWSVIGEKPNGGAAVTMVGHHVDELRREREGWRFVRRKGYLDLPSKMPSVRRAAEPDQPLDARKLASGKSRASVSCRYASCAARSPASLAKRLPKNASAARRVIICCRPAASADAGAPSRHGFSWFGSRSMPSAGSPSFGNGRSAVASRLRVRA